MILQADEHVVRALSLVLGVPGDPEGLDRKRLKAAFRQRAHELHPDKVFALGGPTGESETRFREVKDAYELLSGLLDTHGALSFEPHSASRPDFRPPDPERCAGPASSRKTAWQPGVPRRRLRFAQYLLFSGIIDEKTLGEAMAWQRSNRPRCGDIALGLRYLTAPHRSQVLDEQAHEERFGEAAMRLGLLDPVRLLTVLGRQRRFDRPIGRFFLDRCILSQSELNALLRQQWVHNLACARDRLGKSPAGEGAT